MATKIVSGPIHRITDTFYQVEGSTGRNYTVNPVSGTCTCPDTQFRGNPNCKHLRAVRERITSETETPLEAAARKVQTLTDAELYRLARSCQGQTAGCACLLELARRQAAVDGDAALKAVFA